MTVDWIAAGISNSSDRGGEAPRIDRRNRCHGNRRVDRAPAELGEDRRDLRVTGERRDDMIALAAFVLGQALQLERAPAEAVAHGPGADDRRLDAPDRQGDVGQRQQPAAAAQPGRGAIEAKAIVPQHGAADAGGETERDQQRPSPASAATI